MYPGYSCAGGTSDKAACTAGQASVAGSTTGCAAITTCAVGMYLVADATAVPNVFSATGAACVPCPAGKWR